MSPLHQLLHTLAIEPDLFAVLDALNLTIDQAYTLLNSPEGRAARAQLRNMARLHCQLIAHRNAPHSLHKLAALANDPNAKPETQLKSTQSLLKALSLDTAIPKASHRALPKSSPPSSPSANHPLTLHAAIVEKALNAAAQEITSLTLTKYADPPPSP